MSDGNSKPAPCPGHGTIADRQMNSSCPRRAIESSRFVRRIAITVLIVSLLSACSSRLGMDAFRPPARPLSDKASAHVMLAADGSFGSTEYQGSGRSASLATRDAVAARLGRVDMAAEPQTKDQALRSARRAGTTYVFQPTILFWQDSSANWLGRPDLIVVNVVVWGLASGETVASTVARAASEWPTFGGHRPEDLLPRMMTAFVNRLFARDRRRRSRPPDG